MIRYVFLSMNWWEAKHAKSRDLLMQYVTVDRTLFHASTVFPVHGGDYILQTKARLFQEDFGP